MKTDYLSPKVEIILISLEGSLCVSSPDVLFEFENEGFTSEELTFEW